MSGQGTKRRNLAAEVRRALADENMKGALFHAVSSVNAHRRQTIARFPGYQEARAEARRIKEEAIEALPRLLERLTESVQARGGHVHRADDAEEACRIINSIARDNGVETAVKSKSMTSEEIRLNDALEAAGIAVRETDLGEYIIQLSNDRPSHIVAPIIHKSVEDVRDAFRDGLGLGDVPTEPAELTQLARQQLRAEFFAAELGITGANFLLADTGTVVIVENEGNALMTTQLPPLHIALAGVDKVLPRAADLLPFLQLLPRTATGQLLTSYISFISGPGWSASPLHAGQQRQFHLVLLDNGRFAMRDDPLLREALYCIRCGACMTVCPPYQVLGGHVYGGPTYHSGIGNAWEAGVRDLETAAEFNELCTTCSRCQDVCPVRIDIPWINTVLRNRIAESRRRGRGLVERVVYDRLFPTEEQGSVSLAARLFSDPARVYRMSRRRPWGTMLRIPPVQSMIRRAAGLAAERALPEIADEPLTDWHRRRGGRVITDRRQAESVSNDRRGSTVALFADCHTDHVDVGVGQAAVKCLEKCGLTVVVIFGRCCGRAALSQGMLQTARRQAQSLQSVIEPLATTGHQVVGIEPSCFGAIVDDHRKLIPGGGAAETAGACVEILDFVNQQLTGIGTAAAGVPSWRPRPDQPLKAVLHGHCQQKTLGWLPAAVEVLSAIPGVDVEVTTTECCGMAGSFGYKRDYYGVSAELGQRLGNELAALADAPGAVGAPVRAECYACGTSCRAQISEFGGRTARHPIELVEERLS